MQFLWGANTSMSFETKRRFLQLVGYTLHAALNGEQSTVTQLHGLHASCLDLGLPLLCAVIVSALEKLDETMEALERQTCDDMLDAESEEDVAETEASLTAVWGSRSARSTTRRRPSRASVSFEEPRVHDSGGYVAVLVTVVWNYLWNVRPASVFMSLLSLTIGSFCPEIFCIPLVTFALDAVLIPWQVFPWRQRSEQDQSQLMNYDERLYKALSFYALFVYLYSRTPPLMDFMLTSLVYEPQGLQGCTLLLIYIYINAKNYCKHDSLKLHHDHFHIVWTSLTLSLLPCGVCFLLQRYAHKSGGAHYTGSQPPPTHAQCAVQLATWFGAHLVATLIGSMLRQMWGKRLSWRRNTQAKYTEGVGAVEAVRRGGDAASSSASGGRDRTQSFSTLRSFSTSNLISASARLLCKVDPAAINSTFSFPNPQPRT